MGEKVVGSVDITQAGNAVSSASEKTEGLQADVASDVLLPVGSRAEAAQAIAMVVPSLGVNDPDAFLESLCAGRRGDREIVPIPGSARILDPLLYARRGFALTDTVLATRGGWLTRRFSLIPLSRIQSVSLHQGPSSGSGASPLCARSWSQVRSPLSPRTSRNPAPFTCAHSCLPLQRPVARPSRPSVGLPAWGRSST